MKQTQHKSLRCVIGMLLALTGAFMAPPVQAADKNGSSEEQTLCLWPAPPAEPRIAYVQTIAGPADLGIRPSGWSRMGNWISGANTGKEKFVKPFSVAVDDVENLCVTDTGTGWIWLFDFKHRKAQHWDKAGRIQFVSPVAVAKRKDVIYVADSVLDKVIAFTAKGKLRFTISDPLERPSGLVLSGERLFVADAAAHRIAVFDLSGKLISTFGKRGAAPGELNFPTHLAVESDGGLLVTDSMNSRIQIFDAEGRFRRVIGSAGDGSGHFSRPKGVAADTFGHIYAVDALFDNFQIFNREGRFLLDVGTSGSGPGRFWLPVGIAIDRSNQIFVADSYNQRIQVFKYLGGL